MNPMPFPTVDLLGQNKISDDGPSKISLFAKISKRKGGKTLGILLFHDFDPNFKTS